MGAIGAFGLRGADTVCVVYVPTGADTVYARASGTARIFEYQYLVLDGRASTGPSGLPLRYVWRQIGGSPVCITDSIGPISVVLGRKADTLQFELYVTDTLALIGASGRDTVTVVAGEPGSVYDYLRISAAGKTVGDGDCYVSLFEPVADFSWSTRDSIAYLAGMVGGAFETRQLYWSVANRYWTDSGSTAITAEEFKDVAVPLAEGDNWVTVLYAVDDFERVAVDRVLISHHQEVAIDSFTITPDAFWYDSAMHFDMTLRVAGPEGYNVELVQLFDSAYHVDWMQDNGLGPDTVSLAGDSIYARSLSGLSSQSHVVRDR